MESKKYKKLLNIKKNADSDIENKLVVFSGRRKFRESRSARYQVQNKLQGYVVQHKEYNQYFIITVNEVKPLKIVNHYIVHL